MLGSFISDIDALDVDVGTRNTTTPLPLDTLHQALFAHMSFNLSGADTQI